jgi:uncharacterized membrane protein YgcG
MVAIDFDGSSAMQKALELSKGEPLPDTVSFTSNRPGREQRLYLIPQEYWKAVRTTKIKTGVVGDDGKLEQLELRWDGCQSVLPPSIHPMTGHYRWRKSPKEVAIAPAPMWVIEAMLVDTEGADTPLLNHQSPTQEQNPWTDTDWALSYLNALSSFRADDYDDWLAVGMALHSVSDSLLTDWNSWSRQSPKYKPGDCEKKWKSFKREGKIAIGTLAHMAKQDGWRSFSGGIGSSSNGGSRRGGSGGSGGDDGGDGGNGKIVTHPKFTPITSDELDQRLNELIAQNIIGSKLTTHLHRLAVEAQWHINELKKLYFERKSETEQTEEQGTKLANVKPGAI